MRSSKLEALWPCLLNETALREPLEPLHDPGVANLQNEAGQVVKLPQGAEERRPVDISFSRRPMPVEQSVGVLQMDMFEQVAARLDPFEQWRTADILQYQRVPGINAQPDIRALE